MIELLTVIAIIAILAAIIFPVFGTARESVRRGACISNMQKLSQAVKLFQLDNRRYPDYLYGPAMNSDGTRKTDNSPNAQLSMSQVAGYLRAVPRQGQPDAALISAIQREYRNSLFPEYINDLSVYKCPNNTDVDTPNTAAGLATRLERAPNNQAVVVTQGFYRYDSYDANPTIATASTLDPNTLQARYSRVWEPLLNGTQLAGLSTEDRERYQNQLVFREPSSDTYITMCTYHVPKGKIIVLWLNGSAKVLDTVKLTNSPTYAGTAPIDYFTYKMKPGG
jgi:type II secretory pathway pseudopilin PulG